MKFNTPDGKPIPPEQLKLTLRDLYRQGVITLGEVQSMDHYISFHEGTDYPDEYSGDFQVEH